MTAGISELLTWLTGGSAPAALIKVLLAVFALVLWLWYRRQVGVLGANRRVAAERQAYDALRESLVGSNLATRLYARWLTAFLDRVDRFFGDAGMADRTLLPHAFGLSTPAPLGTAPALDRCLLLAFIYPIITIWLIWAISGHVGPAERVLRLEPGLSLGERAFAAALVGFPFVPVSRRLFERWKRPTRRAFAIAILAASLLALAAAMPVAGAGVGYILFVGYFAIFAVYAGVGAVAVATIVAINVAGPVIAATAGSYAELSADMIGALAVGFGVRLLGRLAVKGRWQGLFLFFVFTAMFLISFVAARLLSHLDSWGGTGGGTGAGPTLLFLGLLTLVNALFDWGSLGLTRALLRRGLELGGWWPYLLAVADALLAAVVVAALALVMVVIAQTFDGLATHGGGAPVLPLDKLFDGIAADPTAPEYWWLYALLLSTMIPSLVNLVIGGTSLVRGLPGVPSLLLRFIPARGTVPKFDRAWIATGLTAQVAAGAGLGIAAQVFLVIVIIGYAMPFFGLELLDMARDVAAFNLPVRVGQLFGVSL